MDSGRSGAPLGRALRFGGLALAAAAAFWVGSSLAPSSADGQGDEVVAPVLRPRVAPPAPAPVTAAEPWPAAMAAAGNAGMEAGTSTERLNDQAVHNPFASLNVQPPAPPIMPKPSEPKAARKPVKVASAPPPPPPPPVAPPLPFTAVGAIEGPQVAGGKPTAFVRQQDQLLLVRAGDTIGQSYKVESVSAQKVEFIYLPLMQRQTLALSP